MNTRRHTSHPAVAVGLASAAIALSLAGCNGGTGSGDGTTSTSSTTTSSTSTGNTPSSSSSSSSSTPSSTTTSSTAAQRCLASTLRPAIQSTSGAAGSTYLTIGLTNVGSKTCTLRGYPGVSIVGHGDGTQIGAGAKRDTTATPVAVTLAAGHATTFVLQVAQAGNYPAADCSPVAGDGLRIYPPDSTQALYLADSHLTGCAKQSVVLLTVRPVGVAAG